MSAPREPSALNPLNTTLPPPVAGDWPQGGPGGIRVDMLEHDVLWDAYLVWRAAPHDEYEMLVLDLILREIASRHAPKDALTLYMEQRDRFRNLELTGGER